MIKKVKKIVVTLLVVLSISAFMPSYVGAYSNTGYAKAYSSYHRAYLADLESRIWLSKGRIGHFKNDFDATSSSWVFNLKKGIYITDHTNQITLNKTGVGISLSVSSSSAGGTIKTNTKNIFSQRTKASNSYYRGLNLKNCKVNFPYIGVRICTVRGTSTQEVRIDGQRFTNVGECTGLYFM